MKFLLYKFLYENLIIVVYIVRSKIIGLSNVVIFLGFLICVVKLFFLK